MPTPSAAEYQAIRNTISRYCIALDTKEFGSLKSCFAEDIEAHYPPLEGQVNGLQTVMAKLEKRLAPVTSHHALSTQTIEIAPDGKSAQAQTYYTGVHFGQGRWEGGQVTAYGKYVDSLVLHDGSWLIKRRDLVFMGTLGNPDVMKGEIE